MLVDFKRLIRRGAMWSRKKIYHEVNNLGNILRGRGKRIGVVSCDKWKGRVLDDLLLQKALIRAGFRTEIISWQDDGVNYRNYDGLVIGSMWGYQNYLEDFLAWIEKMKQLEVRIFNNLKLVENNYDKKLQLEILTKNRLPHVKTEVVRRGVGNLKKILENTAFPYVVKPSISGGGEGAFLIRNESDLKKALEALQEINGSRDLLVQPFMKEICKGEVSVVVIDGEISHAVLRRPGVFKEGGEFKVDLIPELRQDVEVLARKVIEVPDYAGALYMRIDVVMAEEGVRIMELELFEPQLFYYLLPRAKRREVLAAVVRGVLAGLQEF